MTVKLRPSGFHPFGLAFRTFCTKRTTPGAAFRPFCTKRTTPGAAFGTFGAKGALRATVAPVEVSSLAWMSALEIAGRSAAGELDPQDVVKAHLASIERFDTRLHAYIHVDKSAQAGHGPLAGITLAIKDSLPVAGMPWTDGSAVWRDRVASEDMTAVARLRTAGAAILGKTNLPELAAAVGTTNAIFPATNNPWREGFTPGGSTGGSGAAVAAGLATAGVGTDMGGSIRIPASCCGVVGLRPSPNTVPDEQADPAGLSVIGPIARTVADVRLVFSAMADTVSTSSSRSRHRIGVADSTAPGIDDAGSYACRRRSAALASAGHQARRTACGS